ncbi:MAG TPA: 3-hydroxybutyrate dehydrogenase, partial [Methylomirabilota bacterium]|nr:3-hydroxybutyrate dehydrogenase [Methylomirabilota bacterium]
MNQLSGKVAIVTGSTSGIGLAIARGLAEAGAAVVLNGLGEPQLVESLVREMREAGAAEAAHHPADMQRPEEVAALVQSAIERFGRLDILVNNAGIQHVSPIEHFPTERWDAVIAINLSAPFHAIRAALPQMRRAGWGRIINIASAHGLVASRDKSAYVAAKHGVVGLTKVAALEAAGSGITCNAICPAWVLTPLAQKQIDARAAALGGDDKVAIRQM